MGFKSPLEIPQKLNHLGEAILSIHFAQDRLPQACLNMLTQLYAFDLNR